MSASPEGSPATGNGQQRSLICSSSQDTGGGTLSGHEVSHVKEVNEFVAQVLATAKYFLALTDGQASYIQSSIPFGVAEQMWRDRDIDVLGKGLATMRKYIYNKAHVEDETGFREKESLVLQSNDKALVNYLSDEKCRQQRVQIECDIIKRLSTLSGDSKDLSTVVDVWKKVESDHSLITSSHKALREGFRAILNIASSEAAQMITKCLLSYAKLRANKRTSEAKGLFATERDECLARAQKSVTEALLSSAPAGTISDAYVKMWLQHLSPPLLDYISLLTLTYTAQLYQMAAHKSAGIPFQQLIDARNRLDRLKEHSSEYAKLKSDISRWRQNLQREFDKQPIPPGKLEDFLKTLPKVSEAQILFLSMLCGENLKERKTQYLRAGVLVNYLGMEFPFLKDLKDPTKFFRDPLKTTHQTLATLLLKPDG